MADEKKYTLEELEEKLTKKERDFCHFYIIDWNGARAAREAGYKEESVYSIASQNLTKLHINQYINFIKDDIAKEAGISKLSLINELKLIAFSNLPQIILKFEEGGLESLSEDEQKVIVEYNHNKKQLGGEDGSVLDTTTKLKLHDKRGAIQDILKAMGWNEADKLEHSGSIEQPVKTDLSKLSEKTLKQVEKELNKNADNS